MTNRKFTLLAMSIAMGVSTSALAQQSGENQGFYINGFADYYSADWNNIPQIPGLSIGESFSFGADLGYRFNPSWAARIEFADHDYAIKGSSRNKSGNRMGADILYHFNDLPVYGFVGAKRIKAYDSFDAANAGIGVFYAMTDGWSLNAETSLFESLDNDYSDFGVKLGLAYSFGQAPSAAEPVKAAPKPQPQPEPVAVIAKPQDSDNDSVLDENDKCPNTPEYYAVDVDGCTLYQERDSKVRLLVNFDNDSSGVTRNYLRNIANFAEYLKKHPESKVLLEGHTSAPGSAEYNKKLSKRRASTVKYVFVNTFKIDAERIQVEGFGEERLKNTANTEQAHEQNRRVEAVVTVKQKTPVPRQN